MPRSCLAIPPVFSFPETVSLFTESVTEASWLYPVMPTVSNPLPDTSALFVQPERSCCRNYVRRYRRHDLFRRFSLRVMGVTLTYSFIFCPFFYGSADLLLTTITKVALSHIFRSNQENFYDAIKKPRKAFIFIHDTYSLRGYVFIIIKLLSCNNVWIYLFKDTDVLLHTNKFISIYSAFINLNLLFFKTLKYAKHKT